METVITESSVAVDTDWEAGWDEFTVTTFQKEIHDRFVLFDKDGARRVDEVA